MGMFDTVIYKGREYQTKSLACMLDVYTITDDGRLISDDYVYESMPDDVISRKDGTTFRLPQMKQVVTAKNVDQNYHGYLDFHGEENGKFVDYHAKFTDGKLVEIERHVVEHY